MALLRMLNATRPFEVPSSFPYFLTLQILRLHNMRPVLPTRLLKASPSLQIRCDPLISLHLTRHQRDRLLRQALRYTHDAIEITDQVIPRMNGDVLIVSLEANRRVDLCGHQRCTTKYYMRYAIAMDVCMEIHRCNKHTLPTFSISCGAVVPRSRAKTG